MAVMWIIVCWRVTHSAWLDVEVQSACDGRCMRMPAPMVTICVHSPPNHTARHQDALLHPAIALHPHTHTCHHPSEHTYAGRCSPTRCPTTLCSCPLPPLECGVDGVKVDVEATLCMFGHSGRGGHAAMGARWHESLEASVAQHLGGQAINSMCCSTEDLYKWVGVRVESVGVWGGVGWVWGGGDHHPHARPER